MAKRGNALDIELKSWAEIGKKIAAGDRLGSPAAI